MDLSTLLQLDPYIALGIANERLRLECTDLEDLIGTCGVDAQQLIDKMQSIGYHYDSASNQFKANR